MKSYRDTKRVSGLSVAPKGTPSDIVKKLNAEINAGLVDAQLQARLVDMGESVVAQSAAEFGQRIAHDADKWVNVIQTAHSQDLIQRTRLWQSYRCRTIHASPTSCAPAKPVRPFPPRYSKDAKTGKLTGPWAEVARELAAHVGVKAVLMEFSAPPAVVRCMNDGACDIAFLGFDPTRAAEVEGFSPPFVR